MVISNILIFVPVSPFGVVKKSQTPRSNAFLRSDSDGFSWGKNVGCGEGGPHLIHVFFIVFCDPHVFLPGDFSRFVMFYRSPALTMRRCLRKVQAARASMCTKKGREVLLKVEQTGLDSQDSKHGRRRWIASRWMFFLMLSGPSAWQIHHLVASRIISSRQI